MLRKNDSNPNYRSKASLLQVNLIGLNIFHHFSDVNALVDTIIECTEKIILHTQVFCKDLLSKGEVKKLMIVLSSVKLVKNKVVFFKSLFGKKIPKDYMDGDLEELIQSIYTQVIEYYKR